jgi:hypothetical protein
MATRALKVHGQVAAGAFFGYTPMFVRAYRANVFTADTVDATTGAITEGGYSKAMKAFQALGSVTWASAIASDDDYITVMVDYPTFNMGGGATTSGAMGALKDALVGTVGGAAGNYTITTSTVLNSDGTFTFA